MMGVRHLPDAPEEEYYDGFGDTPLDVPPPDLSFSDEQYRRDDLYSQPGFVKYLGPAIINTPFSAQAKRALNTFSASWINREAQLGYNKSVLVAVDAFRLALVVLKTGFTPRDVRIPEYASLMDALESYYEKMVSRTVGGPVIRERILQHGQHVTQRVEQVATAQPVPTGKEPQTTTWDV